MRARRPLTSAHIHYFPGRARTAPKGSGSRAERLSPPRGPGPGSAAGLRSRTGGGEAGRLPRGAGAILEPAGGPRPRPASPRRLLGRPPPRTCLGAPGVASRSPRPAEAAAPTCGWVSRVAANAPQPPSRRGAARPGSASPLPPRWAGPGHAGPRLEGWSSAGARGYQRPLRQNTAPALAPRPGRLASYWLQEGERRGAER